MKTTENKNNHKVRKIAIVALLLLLLVPTTVGVINNRMNANIQTNNVTNNVPTNQTTQTSQQESITDDSVALSSPDSSNGNNNYTPDEASSDNSTYKSLSADETIVDNTLTTNNQSENTQTVITSNSDVSETVEDEDIPLDSPDNTIAELTQNLNNAKAAELQALEALNLALNDYSIAEADLNTLKTAKISAVAEFKTARAAKNSAVDSFKSACEKKAEYLDNKKDAKKAVADAKTKLSDATSAYETAMADYSSKKEELKIYEAIKVLEKGIEKSELNEVSMSIRGQKFFEWCLSLNSTGKNYAPPMNEYLEQSNVLDSDDKYTYRIELCKGVTGNSYNIYMVLEDISDKNINDVLENVVKYNTVTKTFMIGNTVVTRDNDNNKVINGELCSNNAVDISLEVAEKYSSCELALATLNESKESIKLAKAEKQQAYETLTACKVSYKEAISEKEAASNVKEQAVDELSLRREAKIAAVKTFKSAKADLSALKTAVDEATTAYKTAVENTAKAKAELDNAY